MDDRIVETVYRPLMDQDGNLRHEEGHIFLRYPLKTMTFTQARAYISELQAAVNSEPEVMEFYF